MTRFIYFQFLGTILALSIGSSAKAEQKRLSIDEFLREVLAKNPSLEASKLRIEALEHRIRPVGTLDDPFVAAGIDEIPFGGGSGSVTRYQVSQTIPFPGKLSARATAAQKRADSAEADFDAARRAFVITATQAYYRTYYNHQQILLNEDSRRFIQQAIESTKARYKTGGDGHHDWLIGRVELGALQAERLRLEREQKSLHALLNELRGQEPEQQFFLEEPNFSKLPPGYKPNVNLASQPEVKSLQTQKEVAEADERIARLAYFPDFVVQGMVMKPRMSESQEMGSGNWGIMVGVNIPLFFWRKQSELVSAAQAEQRAAEFERKSLENRLNSVLTDAREQLKTALDVVSLYKNEVIPNTEIAVKTSRSGYAARRLPLTQLLEVIRIERIQKLEFLAAKIDAEIARVRLDNLVTSAPSFKLTPGRPTLFGGASGMGESMGEQEMSSSTVNLGSGMSGPSRKENRPSQSGTSSGGMGNM